MKKIIIATVRTYLVMTFIIKSATTMQWYYMATSKAYENTKLVVENVPPFLTQYISKEHSVAWARILCSQTCAKNTGCVVFNFYSTNTSYVCEFLNQSFCSPNQRIALQAWTGSTVWDKLNSTMSQACIEQKLSNTSTGNYCQIGRSGCQGVWPNCDFCVQTCKDCFALNNQSGPYNCTLWPEGAFQRPIFAFCDRTSIFLIQRKVLLDEGRVASDYLMPFEDMSRLNKLRAYKFVTFTFTSTTGTNYTAKYEHFAIDDNGTLSNITFTKGRDGFKTGAKPLKPAPFTMSQSSDTYNCGSFWLLKSTHGKEANQNCPGGGVNMFGKVIKTRQKTDTGIKWPQATSEKAVLVYADMQMGV